MEKGYPHSYHAIDIETPNLMSIVEVRSHDVQISQSSFITCATGLTLASHVELQFVHDILKCCTGYSP